MRSYPRNSPEAATRIVALTLLADAHLGGSELAALDRLAQAGRFGLDAPAVDGVVRDAVQDLLLAGGAAWHGTAHLEPGVIDGVLREIDEPALREQLLALCRAVARADRHVSDGEQAFLAAMAREWNLPAQASA